MCPGEGKAEKISGSKNIGCYFFWGIPFLILIIITFFVSGIKRNIHRELKDIHQSYESVKLRNTRIKQAKESRILFFEKQSFLMHPGKFALEAALFLNTLSRITPHSVELIELKMTPRNRNLGFDLKGVISPSVSAQGGVDSDVFYSRINSIDRIIHLSRNISTTSSRPGFFQFQGEIEIE